MFHQLINDMLLFVVAVPILPVLYVADYKPLHFEKLELLTL